MRSICLVSTNHHGRYSLSLPPSGKKEIETNTLNVRSDWEKSDLEVEYDPAEPERERKKKSKQKAGTGSAAPEAQAANATGEEPAKSQDEVVSAKGAAAVAKAATLPTDTEAKLRLNCIIALRRLAPMSTRTMFIELWPLME